MKRVWSFALVLLLVALTMSGCTQKAPQEQEPEETSSLVLVDKNDVKITYTGIKLTQYLPNQVEAYMLTVGLVIENTSEVDITVLPLDSSVNDVMKTAASGIPLTVLSGKKGVTGFFFANLEGTGVNSVNDIDQVEKIEFYLSVVNNDTFNEIFRSELITLTP